MKDQFRVTAIVSTYKSERFLRGCLDDLLSQTIGDDLEIIVVNSGSPQGEDEIVRREYLPFHDTIRYVRTEERETIYQAWNRGIRSARGRFITNANTDDRLRKDAYERLADHLDRHPDVGAVFADQYTSYVQNEVFTEHRGGSVRRRPSFDRLLFLSRYYLGSQPMWRSEVHSQHGIYYSERYAVAGDYEFFLRLAEHYPIEKVHDILGLYYLDPGGNNMEYQNAQRTAGETEEVRTAAIHRWVDALTPQQVRLFLHRMQRYQRIPELMHYGIFNMALSLGIPTLMLPRGFVCYVGSVLAEKAGDMALAIRFCSGAAHSRNADVLSKRKQLLLSRGTV
ncbi:MAG: glycosyltransferase [Bacteroidetes bacterium]|nr:glycosyltransferase [Bacteroidota bacterium]